MVLSHGDECEARVRTIAARLGVADFVFTAPQVPKGGATREVSGDGLLIVGDVGAILQVKDREPNQAALDQPDRTAAWIAKNIHRAAAQGAGTRREIARRQQRGEGIKVLPARALDLSGDKQAVYALSLGGNVAQWPVIVVVDHEQAHDQQYTVGPNTFVITLDDWLQLHQRIRSTHGLITYASRVIQSGLTVPLGHEARRYVAMYAADRGTDNASATWTTGLPPPDYAGGPGTVMFRQILDRVWPDDGFMPWADPGEYRKIVEFLDRIPAHIQEVFGQKVIEYCRRVATTKNRHSGGMLYNDTQFLQVIVATTAHGDREHHMATTAALTFTRHSELIETGGTDDVETLGVGILVDPALGTAYSFVYTDGQPNVPDDIRREVEHRYGRFDFSQGRVVDPAQHDIGSDRDANNPGGRTRSGRLGDGVRAVGGISNR